jgi:DNA-binding NarL/FixJ family response regulator
MSRRRLPAGISTLDTGLDPRADAVEPRDRSVRSGKLSTMRRDLGRAAHDRVDVVSGVDRIGEDRPIMRVVTDATPIAVMLVDPAEPHLAAILDAGGFTVRGTASSGKVVRAAADWCPDVVLVDLDGPAGPAAGTAAVEELTGVLPRLPVVVLSAVDAAPVVLGAVRAGAASYLLRTTSASRLVDAVRRTASGEAVFSPGLAAAVLEAETGGAGEGPARLTEREADILQLVVAGHTARQIAGRLVLSPRTVENHVNNMLRKLDVPNRAALVRYAIENGLA